MSEDQMTKIQTMPKSERKEILISDNFLVIQTKRDQFGLIYRYRPCSIWDFLASEIRTVREWNQSQLSEYQTSLVFRHSLFYLSAFCN